VGNEAHYDPRRKGETPVGRSRLQADRTIEALLAPGRLSDRRAGWVLTAARWASAAIFVSFGLGKFVNHGSETNSFRGYGLPSPGLFADAIGVIELVGGLLLVFGLVTRVAAIVLAGDMVGAIVVSGILKGEMISLTLAPALLVAMIVLIAMGPGQLSVDARLRRGVRARGP
jgi:putative oxidoreductase